MLNWVVIPEGHKKNFNYEMAFLGNLNKADMFLT